MTTPAKARQTHEDAPGRTIAPSGAREVHCVVCKAKATTLLPAPDGWEDGLCRRCVVLSGLLR